MTTRPAVPLDVVQRARQYLRSFGYVTANAETNHALVRDLLALVEDGPRLSPEDERYLRIGKLFAELWELGAPWPIRHWTCDKHKVIGCLRCREALRDADARVGRKE